MINVDLLPILIYYQLIDTFCKTAIIHWSEDECICKTHCGIAGWLNKV